MKLDGASAVVTGGASGLGLATARRLLKEGAAAVVIADLPSSAGAEVAAELGDRAHFVAADVRSADEAQLRKAVGSQADWLLRLSHGDDPREWSWGALHSVTFMHAPLGQSGIRPLELLFNSETLPAPGDTFTVNEATPDVEKPFNTSFGVSQRMIVDLSDFDRTLAVNSTGQSGLPFHRHRVDQVRSIEGRPLVADRKPRLLRVESAADPQLSLAIRRLLLTVLAVGLVVWLVVSYARPRSSVEDNTAVARRILAERYARGEVDTEEYTQRLAALR